MKIELTDREVRRIVPILRTQYHKEKCTVSEIDVTGLANSMVVTMNELEKRINMNESQLSTNDELREIRQERKWIINQMHEVVDSLNCSLGRLSRKLQENIGKEKVALVE